ncbi:hypothetical protein L367_00515 [Klebsiella pneumoniae MGH 21]|uniref:DUF551 domain-containing protein n=1 Tax=Klebsiella pneumoniae TaxID=573 RepID=UPI0003BE604F|nr:DUF551 domain-containing protein [Klebsiella pneumoniae]ESN44145.1 hypothetical protein L367_00515 [Klebsiella pneumoniae MGH 21]
MTSKFSIDNRELLQRISSGEAVVGIDFGNLIVRELAAFRLAAMDSEPVAYISKSDFDAGYPHILARRDFNKACTMPVYAAQPAPVVEREPIAWLNDAYLARGVVDGEAGSEDAGPGYIPVYREAGPQSAPVVPEEITIETATIIAYGLPTTNIGAIFKAGHDACRAAMLQELKKSAGTEAICRSDENVQVLHTKSPAQTDCCPAQNHVSPEQNHVSPEQNGDTPAQSQGWIPVSERMPTKQDGSVFLTWNGQYIGKELFLMGSFQCLKPEIITHWMPLPAPPTEVK